MRYEIEITEAAESDLDRIHAFYRGKSLTRSMRICATSQLVKAGRVSNASSCWTHLRIACGWETTGSSMMLMKSAVRSLCCVC